MRIVWHSVVDCCQRQASRLVGYCWIRADCPGSVVYRDADRHVPVSLVETSETLFEP